MHDIKDILEIEKILHIFEAGRRGKPDELDSGIAHIIGAYLLKLDPYARFDLRINGDFQNNKPHVTLKGEISSHLLQKNNEKIIRDLILNRYNQVHRTNLTQNDLLFDYDPGHQSGKLADNGNAGDSGSPIAVAYKNSPNQLPWERHIAVAIRDILDTIYYNDGKVPEYLATKSGILELKGLRADGKVEVGTLYDGAKFDSLTQITLAAEHKKSLKIDELRDKGEKIISAYLNILSQKYKQELNIPKIIINGAGAWNIGGWQVDAGSREAKPYRDSFATYGTGEDSFSGEDPTKPSATGTFLARYIANQVVGNELANFARVALTYAIGTEEVGLNIFTNGTSKYPQAQLERIIRSNIHLRIKDAITRFDLRNPALYEKIVQDSDFFHNPNLPWNQVKELIY